MERVMTDYVKALNDPKHPYHQEAKRNAETLPNDASVSPEGVLTWKSNGRVPFDDMLDLARVVGIEFNYAASRKARDRQNDQFIKEYRKARAGKPVSDEERFEARAAFGPGVEIVNVLTGQKYRT